MEPKNSKIFDKKNIQTVSAFCSTNNIEDVDNFIYRCFKKGFDIERFGLLGNSLNEIEKDLKTGVVDEKQAIKEVIVEKEIIKEVPVEKVVTKIEYISDKTNENELLSKIEQLNEEMSKKDKELDELRRNLDDTQTKMLQETLQKLRKEILDRDEKIKELEIINQELKVTKNPLKGFFMKGSNLNDTI